jgi:MFS family permease
VLGPVLPFIMRDLAMDDAWKTPLASVWMVARVLTVVVLGTLHFWHGRWATLAAALLLLGGGFAAVAFAPGIPMLLVGLAAFGAGHGVVYFAGLYYAMAVGGAEVDAGGRFEALIGAGYVVGPLAGLVAGATAGGLVGATLGAAAIGLVPAVFPYLAWRRKAAEAAAAAAR